MTSKTRNEQFDLARDVVSSSAMQGASRYFAWQYDLMAGHLGPRVLEVGCGVGEFTRTLLGRERVVSVDLEPQVIEVLRNQLTGHPEWSGVVADLADPELPSRLGHQHFDSVTALNVIEHIEDDVAALRSLRAVLPVGGKAAVLVPAHRALYGAFDAAVGHYRRYTTRELAERLHKAGFAVDRCFYFNAVGAIGWWVNYRLLRVTKVGRGTTAQVGAFDRWIVPVMRRVETIVPPPFGLSVIALATAHPAQSYRSSR